MATLFVSDVHLSLQRPHLVDAFCDFLGGPARQASHLYVLGDLFDAWLGDDDFRDPHPRVESALAATVAAGVPISFAHGNHDFLVGESFLARTGCELLRDPAVVELGGCRALLMHGDSLCTEDRDYQAFRAYSRQPAHQAEFLALPMAARVTKAQTIRNQSRAATELKPDDIMDVTQQAVVAAMQAHNVRHMVHGHTHRPAIHAVDLGNESGQRVVLGDWYEQDSIVTFDGGTFTHCRIRDL